MADFDIYREYGEELEKRIRLKTFPLAVKLLKEEGDIPDGYVKPMERLLTDTQVLQSYRQASRIKAQQFDINTVADSYERIYQDILEK